MSAMCISVQSYNETISQNRDAEGNLPHIYTFGRSKYHKHIYYSWGLGCSEDDCEMNNSLSYLSISLRKRGF